MTEYRIPFTYGGEIVGWALVDEADFDSLRRFRWTLACGYAVRADRGKQISMHREVAGLRRGDSRVVHHRNEGMSVIWKFPLAFADAQQVAMPEDADLLHVDEQDGVLTLWARVIPTGQREVNRTILIRGTGRPIWQQPHVGTVLTASGLVWHVFDGGEA